MGACVGPRSEGGAAARAVFWSACLGAERQSGPADVYETGKANLRRVIAVVVVVVVVVVIVVVGAAVVVAVVIVVAAVCCCNCGWCCWCC